MIINSALIAFTWYLIILAFVWLMLETNFLTVRLPCGASIKRMVEYPFVVEVAEQIPEPVKREYFNPCANLLPEKCGLTLQLELAQRSRVNISYGVRRVAPKLSYQQFTVGNQVCTLLATLPNLYEIWADVLKAQDVKQRDGIAQAPCKQIPMFIEYERSYWNGKSINSDHEKTYHDCLVSADWLKAHEYDLDDFNPTLEVSCNGQELTFTPDDKNKVKEFMGQFTQRVKVGKHTEAVFPGYQIVDMGGGLKVVTYPHDKLDDAIELTRERATVEVK